MEPLLVPELDPLAVPELEPLVVPELDPLAAPDELPLEIDPDEPDPPVPLSEAVPEVTLAPLDAPLFTMEPEATSVPDPAPLDVPLPPVPPPSSSGSMLRSSMPRRFAQAATASALPAKSRIPTRPPAWRHTISRPPSVRGRAPGVTHFRNPAIRGRRARVSTSTE